MKNISLRVGGEALDMNNETIRLDLLNPIFNEIGSYSLPFNIPLTSHNKNVLGISHSSHIYEHSLSFKAILYASFLRVEGKLNLKNTNNNFIETHFTTGKGAFYNDIKNVKLTDIPYTEEISTGSVGDSVFREASKETLTNVYPEKNYVFAPIYMPNFKDIESPSSALCIVNPWSIADLNFRFTTSYEAFYTPLIYLHFVIKKIFETYGYVIETDELYANSELRMLVVFNNNFKLNSILQLDFSKNLPDILISDFLNNIENRFNIIFLINDNNKTVHIKFVDNIITGSVVSDLTNIASSEYEVNQKKYNSVIISNEFDSNDSYISDEVKSINHNLNNDNIDHFVNAYSDLPGSANVGDIAYVLYENKIYIWDFNYDAEAEEWQDSGKSWHNYISDGNNPYEFNSKVSSMLMTPFSGGTAETNFNNLPRNNYERIRNPVEGVLDKLNRISLLFYRGLVPYRTVQSLSDLSGKDTAYPFYVIDEEATYEYDDVTESWIIYSAGGNFDDGFGDNYYPLLSSSMFYNDDDGGSHLIPGASYTLSMFGTNGIFENFFQNTAFWITNFRKLEKRKLHWSLKDLTNIAWDQKYKIKEQKYFISKISIVIDFEKDQITSDKTELLTV
jgi:hypothetical protein